MLVNDGIHQELLAIMAPYQPGKYNISDYAVEAKIQLVKATGSFSFGMFGIIVRDTGKGAYNVGFDDVYRRPSKAIILPGVAERPYTLNTEWRKYRAEVKGNTIKLFIDDTLQLEGIDNRYLSGGQVGLWSGDVVLNISSFKVIKL